MQAYFSGVPVADSSFSVPDPNTAFLSASPASFGGDDLAFWSATPTALPEVPGGGSPGRAPRRTVILPPRERPKKETVPNHALTIAMMLALYLDSE